MKQDLAADVADILDTVGAAERFVVGLTAEAFAEDERAQFAVARSLAMMGAVAKRVPGRGRGHAPSIPWRAMRVVHDHVLHDARPLDARLLWRTVQDEFPAVRSALERLLAELDAEAADRTR